jgi:hypothetical protein
MANLAALTVGEYQVWLRDRLSKLLGVDATVEWPAFPGMQMYSPRVDVAIGPFSVDEGTLGREYDELVRDHRTFFRQLIRLHDLNIQGFDPGELSGDLEVVGYHNWNARCLIAIEVENIGSRKHLMGSAVNASSLGRVGLAVGWNEDRVRRFIRMRRYLRALAGLNKNTFNTTNLLIMSKDQLAQLVVES